jgi:hypothetical protein
MHHLTPNSILHLSIFTHMCEAFLGIDPHFDLFRNLFRMRPQPSIKKTAEIEGAEILLHPEMEEKYLYYHPTSLKAEWKNENDWFYVGNHHPALPERVPGPPKVCDKWSDAGPGGEQVSVDGHKITF